MLKFALEELAKIERKLGYTFNDKVLLSTALTSSTADAKDNYEKLEFFGDGYLRYALPKLIDERYPGSHQGELTRMYSVLSCNATLAHTGLRLGVPSVVKLGNSKIKFHLKLIADVVEAIIGAVEQDSHKSDVLIQICRRIFRTNIELIRFDRPIELLTQMSSSKSNRNRISFHVYPRSSNIACSGYIAVVNKGKEVVVDNGEGINAEWAMYNAAALALLRLYPKTYPAPLTIQWRL
ncbi:MAG: ribonuclease III family protein [Deltaproteobacteria bacterium]|nr:ribonuclease III family protein [Deltaproteobacteria bacterium]